jgi:nucleotide-binding universal stress UspA family protein
MAIHMKKILVPTDFSDTARSAFVFAQQIAEYFGGAYIKVVHSFVPPVEAEYPNFIPAIEEYIKVREQMLQNFLDDLTFPQASELHLDIDQEVLIGFAVDEITKISSDFDLIVMGKTGESGFLDNIFGRISSGVSQKSRCPVILVPNGMAFHGIKHILYASNYESTDEEKIEQIKEFNKPFNAFIHFVHVNKNQDEGFDKSKEQIFEELFEEGEPPFPFEIEEIEGESIVESLNEYSHKHPIDLIVMVNCKRNFWQQLVHKSQTKKMATRSDVPLMVYHMQ